VVSDRFQTLLGRSRGFALFLEKKLNLNTAIALPNGPAITPKYTKSKATML